MREVGEDIRRGKKAVMKLADTVQGMMNQWTEDEFPHFKETMELIREHAPVQYAKLYMDAVKMGIVRESNINININRQQDRENLQALVRTRLPTQAVEAVEYTPFEEMKSAEDILLGNNAEIKLERRKTTEED